MPMSRSEANLAYRPFQNDILKYRLFGGVSRKIWRWFDFSLIYVVVRNCHGDTFPYCNNDSGSTRVGRV